MQQQQIILKVVFIHHGGGAVTAAAATDSPVVCAPHQWVAIRPAEVFLDGLVVQPGPLVLLVVAC